jgi:hypothetical protein
MQEAFPRAYSEDTSSEHHEGFDFSMRFVEGEKIQIICEPKYMKKMAQAHPHVCERENTEFYSPSETWVAAEMVDVARSVEAYNRAHNITGKDSELSDWLLTDNGPEEIPDGFLAELTDPDVTPALEKSLLERILPYASEKMQKYVTDDNKTELEANMTERMKANLEESLKYVDTFEHREELGMSVSYFTKTNSDGEKRVDMRYRQKKKKGTTGGFVKKEYMLEAVDALRKYDLLMLSNDERDIAIAVQLAEKYFTEETRLKTKERLKQARVVRAINSFFSEKSDDEDEMPCNTDDLYSHWRQLKAVERVADKYLTDKAIKDDMLSLVHKHQRYEAYALADEVKAGRLNRKTAQEIHHRLSNSEGDVDAAKYLAKADEIKGFVGYVQTVPVARKPQSLIPTPPGIDEVPGPRRRALGSGVYATQNGIPVKVERPGAIPPPPPPAAFRKPRRQRRKRLPTEPPPLPAHILAAKREQEITRKLKANYLPRPTLSLEHMDIIPKAA